VFHDGNGSDLLSRSGHLGRVLVFAALVEVAFYHSSRLRWVVVKDAPRGPGKLGMYPLFSAVASVVNAGEKKEAWAKDTSSAAVAVPTAALASAMAALGISTCHSWWVAGARCPWRMTMSLCRIMMFATVNSTTQPASQSCPMERRECDFRSGTM
jgi:hypothetical protein